ncbi:MAG: zf-HC2 domain-containing protein [Oscillospiraceae bacterium]
MKTIDCALAQDLMPLYTEGMLSPESREALEEHLAGCEACRRTADEMCHPCWSRSFRRRPGCCAACGGGGRPCGRR